MILLRPFSSLAFAVCSSLALVCVAQTSSSTSESAKQTPGFVNNGTIGQYPCAVGTSKDGQVPFVSSQTLADCSEAKQPVYPFNRINLRSPDDSIRATFMPYGARLLEFWVRDRSGKWQDIVLGLDNSTSYQGLVKTLHPFFGPQVGRYANRIKNGTFELDGKTYHTPLNENDIDTLHGGKVGYDQRSYTIESWNASHVTFVLHDPKGSQGFPGSVTARASYTLGNKGLFGINMDAEVTEGKTPIMLSHHVYWALHGYKDSKNTILDHKLHMPKADKYIKTDGILIPTGPIPSVKDTPYDFRQPRTFSERFNQTQGACGTGCQGWDTCFVMSEGHERDETVLALTSPETGIRLRVKTNQDAIQVYTCDGVSSATKGSIPRKYAHGGDGSLEKVYENHSCVVLEMEGKLCLDKAASTRTNLIFVAFFRLH